MVTIASHYFRIGTAEEAEAAKKADKKYFYLEGKLHKHITYSRALDTLDAWSYPDRKRVQYSLTYARKHMQQAISMARAAWIIGIRRQTLRRNLDDGNIRWPQRSYSLDGRFVNGPWRFSEDHVLEIQNYFAAIARKNQKIRSRREVLALLRDEKIPYIKTDDGRFVPVWDAQIEW